MNNTTQNYSVRAHEWLTLLAGVSFATAEGFGNSVCRCRRNGWCRWVIDAKGGMVYSGQHALEEITDSGRAKLSEWNTK